MGSVRFFKHVILAAIVLAIVTPTVFSIVYGLECGSLSRSVNTLKQELVQTKAAAGDNSGSVNEKEVSSSDLSDHLTWTDGLSYQELYPDLYTPQAEEAVYEKDVMYLTFDDGPSTECTAKILDVLKEYGIKATFFVVGRNNDTEEKRELLRRIVAEGHTLGIHSYSHDYTRIYTSVEAFLEDFNQVYKWVYETTGVKPEVFRFPGGSVNSYNADICREIISEMTRRGFQYFDWNMAAQDAVKGGISSGQVTENILDQAERVSRGVVLMHDSSNKETTVEALPGVIAGLMEQGFTFKPLTKEVQSIRFDYIK